MKTNEICPLRSDTTTVKHCDSNCAWNVGSDAKPTCAIVKISFNLSSIESLYTNQ